MNAKTTRRNFLKALGMGAAALAAPGCAGLGRAPKYQTKGRKPNFVLILVDDMGWTDAACYGSKYYETPNIDRLAREGMKFSDGYAACAVCSPTRAAVMTGRYPARIGITDWIRSGFQGGRTSKSGPPRPDWVGGKNRKLLTPQNPFWLEHEEVTIPEALKPAGYISCHIGKWHLGPTDWFPEKQGFNYNIGGCDFGQPPSYFDPYFKIKQGGIPTLMPRKKGEYLTDREADEAAKFILRCKDRPFFLYMAHYAVHTPIQGRAELVEKYNKKTPTNQKNPTYAAMVESVDAAVGRIVAALEEAGVTNETMIIFTSDNGGLLGPTDNQPLRSGKGYPYEGGIREPLIVRWPGVVEAGSETSTPAISVDFFPTLLEAAGVRAPKDREIDGLSLMPVLTQTGALKRDALYWHFPHYRGSDVPPYSIVRAGDWKLIKRYDGKPYELFNLKDDLAETTDLAEKTPDKVKELDGKLTAWLKATGAKMPKLNPDYAPSNKAG